jgi:microcompartment protein CcmL/EutN
MEKNVNLEAGTEIVDDRAVGILEVFGLTTAFLAADAGCKAADVVLENFDKNKPANADALPVPLLVTIKFRGSVTDVEAAVEAGKIVANATTGVVQSYVIPRPTPDCCKMLKLNAFDKR